MTKVSKKYLSFLLIIFISLALTGCLANAKYAAKVNGVYITKEKLEKRTAIIVNYFEKTAKKLTDSQKKAIRLETLKHLIDEELIAQEAKKRGIAITEQQVTDHINSIKKNLGNDNKKFLELIADQGYNTEADYRETIKNQFITKALKEAVTKKGTDPLAQKKEFDEFLQKVEKDASIKIYVKIK